MSTVDIFELAQVMQHSVGRIVRNREKGKPDDASATTTESESSDEDESGQSSDESDDDSEESKKKEARLTDDQLLEQEGVVLKTREQRQRFSKLRKSIPATSTETVRAVLKDVKRMVDWLEKNPEIEETEIADMRNPERIVELMGEYMTHYAQTGKSRDPKYSKIAGTTLDRLCYNMQAAGTSREKKDRLRNHLSAHTNTLIDTLGLARPVSPQGVLGRDAVKLLLEQILSRSMDELTGDGKEAATQKALLVNTEMFSGSRIGGLVSSPGYEEEYLRWEDAHQVVGLETTLVLKHYKGYQDGGKSSKYQMSHPVKDVYNRSNVIFALSWFLLAQALNSGAAHIPEESTLLAWLDTPVDPTNPDDIIQITRLNEPIFVRLAPRGDGLDLSGPFTSSGAHRMIKQPLRKTGMLHGASKQRLSMYSMRKHVLDTHYERYGEAATKLLAGHSQRSHTLRTNYVQTGSRISLTENATNEDAPVVPATVSGTRLLNPVEALSSRDLAERDPELAVYEEMRKTLIDCAGSGSQMWKLAPGFRSLPNVATMTAADALALQKKIEHIIRNKRARLRRMETEGRLDDPATLSLPTSIDRARRVRESEQESSLTSHLDIEQLKAELERAAKDLKNKPDEFDDQNEDVESGYVLQATAIIDLERIMEEDEVLEAAERSLEGSQPSDAVSGPEGSEAASGSATQAPGVITDSEHTPSAPAPTPFSKRDSFLLKIGFLENTLLKPSLVESYKSRQPTTQATTNIETGPGEVQRAEPETALGGAEGTLHTATSTFMPESPGSAKGRCRLCMTDDTVSDGDKEKLRSRSGHAIHVKRHEDEVADTSFHSPRKRLLRFLASKGLDPTSSGPKVPCTLQGPAADDCSARDISHSDAEADREADREETCGVTLSRQQVLLHVHQEHGEEIPADLRLWLAKWYVAERAGRARNYRAKRTQKEDTPDPLDVTLNTSLHALPDLPVDYAVRDSQTTFPPPATTMAVRSLLSPGRHWSGSAEYSPPTPNDPDPVRARLGVRLQQLAARVSSHLVVDGKICLQEETLQGLNAMTQDWSVVDPDLGAEDFLKSMLPEAARKTWNELTDQLV